MDEGAGSVRPQGRPRTKLVRTAGMTVFTVGAFKDRSPSRSGLMGAAHKGAASSDVATRVDASGSPLEDGDSSIPVPHKAARLVTLGSRLKSIP